MRHRHSAQFADLVSMQITVTIPDAFVSQVQSRGLDAETYAKELMEQAVSQELAKTEERREAGEAMMRFAGERKLTLGGLDLKSMVHEDHKC